MTRTESEPSDELSLLTLANILMAQRGLIARVMVFCVLAGAMIGLLSPPEYTSRSVIYPQSGQDTRLQLAGLAAQFGVNVPAGGQGGESPDFYTVLVESRDLLQEAVRTEYEFTAKLDGGDTIRGDLIEIWNIETEPEPRAVRAATQQLARSIGVRAMVNSGLVQITTQSEWPGLAVALNQRLLELLEEFNLRRRQQNALQERQFVEARMEKADQELKQAEQALEAFLERNKIRESAQLQLEESRLTREVDLRQQVYTSLAQSYEQVRIEEVRNTPVFTVVEGPVATLKDTGWGAVVWSAIGIALGLVISFVLAFMKYAVNRQLAEDPASYREFERLRSGLKSDLSPSGVRSLIGFKK